MQAYEDWLRHKADRAINDRVVKKVTEEGGLTDIKAKKVRGHFESKLQLEKTLLIFSQIEVGDIILINDGEEFPADVSPQNLEEFLVHNAVLFLSISQMVILSSSSPQGKANIMTANLG